LPQAISRSATALESFAIFSPRRRIPLAADCFLADDSELHDTQLGGDEGGKSRYDPDAVKK